MHNLITKLLELRPQLWQLEVCLSEILLRTQFACSTLLLLLPRGSQCAACQRLGASQTTCLGLSVALFRSVHRCLQLLQVLGSEVVDPLLAVPEVRSIPDAGAYNWLEVALVEARLQALPAVTQTCQWDTQRPSE